MGDFAELTGQGQVAAVRRSLVDLLRAHGIVTDTLRLALHSYNTTFRLTFPDGDVALRVNVGSKRSMEEVRGEVAWTEAIHREERILAPYPVALFGNSAITTVQVQGMDREVPVVAYRWLPGRHVGKNRPSSSAFLLGRLMSELHEMARHWTLPAGTSRPVLRSVMDELPWVLEDHGVAAEVRNRADAILDNVSRAGTQLVHFDLHFGNVKVHRGRMCVFDFDDCVMTTPGVDAAQAMYYLRRQGVEDRLEEAFWKGASSSPEALGLSREGFEMLIGGRAVLLANDVAGSSSSTLQAMAPKFLRVTERRLRHLMDTGVFDQSVARMTDPD